jgi:hypothetical protein
MDKFTHINVPILNNEYFVLVAWGEQKKAIPWLKKAGDIHTTPKDLEGGRGHWWASNSWHCVPVIYINIPVKDDRFYATVSHESVHAINQIWEYIGEDCKHEAYAHCVAAIVEAVTKEIRKKKK